ncbi:unnamed protein product (macronuclear) [Paramecium tetraurelia]|uniref:Transmembrane protein n=1 Tax=Paramecium tetraurelia TaxID=5888 RepID=A0DHW4_PARTE|nr:uncharacterized protein GSPATT00039507001 [Paramecium tetraurelia]CAK82631.1 unnamed protein product [Paramecium tetraurelia]|eukprot:XP_001450028.1 hypothetical protein (macronuclear) [Paramecium tetraurelia strain d4-2]
MKKFYVKIICFRKLKQTIAFIYNRYWDQFQQSQSLNFGRFIQNQLFLNEQESQQNVILKQKQDKSFHFALENLNKGSTNKISN